MRRRESGWRARLEGTTHQQLRWQKWSEVHIECRAGRLHVIHLLMVLPKSCGVDVRYVTLRVTIGIATNRWLVRIERSMREASVITIHRWFREGVRHAMRTWACWDGIMRLHVL